MAWIKMLRNVARAGLLLSLLGGLAGCKHDSPTNPRDTIPPGTVTDLLAERVGSTSVKLRWRAPGDDGFSGRAASYEIRMGALEFTDSSWSQATVIDQSLVPGLAQRPESLLVEALEEERAYHFALRATDDAGNVSPLSNDALVPATSGPPLQYLPQSSPWNCLANLRRTYTDRTPEAYQRLFAADFAFVFDPMDVTSPDPTPAQWGLADEIESAQHMFQSELVAQIDISFATLPSAPSDDFPGTVEMAINRLRLVVETRRPTGEQLSLICQSAGSIFYFKEFPDERASDGKTLWRIVRWVDQASVPGGLLLERRSWGSIKALYR